MGKGPPQVAAAAVLSALKVLHAELCTPPAHAAQRQHGPKVALLGYSPRAVRAQHSSASWPLQVHATNSQATGGLPRMPRRTQHTSRGKGQGTYSRPASKCHQSRAMQYNTMSTMVQW